MLHQVLSACYRLSSSSLRWSRDERREEEKRKEEERTEAATAGGRIENKRTGAAGDGVEMKRDIAVNPQRRRNNLDICFYNLTTLNQGTLLGNLR